MQEISGKVAIPQVVKRIAELVGAPRAAHQQACAPADVQARVGPFTFVVEWKASSSAAAIFASIDTVRRAASPIADAVPLIAVPYMGPVGEAYCEQADVSWLDLSGNARILAPGLRIHIEGKPNRFTGIGRPASAFAPKSARVARWLLMHEQAVSLRQLAGDTGLGEGFTSRIVSRLAASDLVVRAQNGAIRVPDRYRLLDAWAEVYDFSRHHIIRGHVPARTSEELLPRLAQELRRHQQPYAATGLGAAWLMTHFAAFRIATMYLQTEPSTQLLERIAFQEDGRGANLWLVVPNDEGVFQGAQSIEDVQCVHPVQVYLDLRGHPERATDAARKLRDACLRWRAHG